MAHDIRFMNRCGQRDGFMFPKHIDLGNIGNGCRIQAQRCSSTAAKAARVRIMDSSHSGAMTRNCPTSGINWIRQLAGQQGEPVARQSPGGGEGRAAWISDSFRTTIVPLKATAGETARRGKNGDCAIGRRTGSGDPAEVGQGGKHASGGSGRGKGCRFDVGNRSAIGEFSAFSRVR
jgi:hypothetical protein